jgi:uncharacterized protein (DUF885 family)
MKFLPALATLAALVLGGACGSRSPAPATLPPEPPEAPTPVTAAPDAPTATPAAAPAADPNRPAAGVDSPALAALLTREWDASMALSPVSATSLGDRRFDDKLGDLSAAGVARERALMEETLAAARALPAAELSAKDQLTVRILIDGLERDLGDDVCQTERWAVSGYQSPLDGLDRIERVHPLRTARDAETYLARIRLAPASVDALAAQLVSGAADGLTASKENLTRFLARIDESIARPVDQWSLAQGPRKAVDLPADVRATLVAGVDQAIAEGLIPAYQRLRAAVADKVVPVARTKDGLTGLPIGKACYAARIKAVTGLALDPAEIHAWGKREVAIAEKAILAIGKQRWKARSLADIRKRLATDKAMYFTTEDEVLAAARAAVARATERAPEVFSSLPKLPMEVVPYTPEQMSRAPAPSYSRAAPDGSRPARYNIVTRPPERQGRWTIEAISFHEAIPGHHLQIATSMELGELPAFRRLGGDGTYAEGWALYTETLVREMGLYSDELSLLGAWSFEALRACRLVVDSGIHHLGWTRKQAEDYMLAHTLETPEFVKSEVERYISWPAQAISYKVGSREILRLRAKAKDKLGERFTLHEFHDTVLGAGALSLPVLAERVDAWIAKGGAD